VINKSFTIAFRDLKMTSSHSYNGFAKIQV
jgi:hypothetical protein